MRPARLCGAAAIALVLLIAYRYAATHDLAQSWRELQAGRPLHVPPPRGQAGRGLAQRGGPAKAVLLAARVAMLGAVATCAALAAARLRWRRRRASELVRWELRLGREDHAEPFEIQKALDGICGVLQAPWYERLWRGQDSIALEHHAVADGGIHLTIAGQPRLAAGLRGALSALYPDVTVRPVSGGPGGLRHVVRLKKARHYLLSIQTVRDYQHSFSEALLGTLGELPGPTTVQLVLTPVPRLLARRARRLLRGRERAANQAASRDPAAAGAESVVESKELKGALETAGGHSLYWYDLRVASASASSAATVAGVFAQLRSENELVPRRVRLRRRLYLRRLEAAQPNPLAGALRGVISTSELATIWQLPGPRLKHAPLTRTQTRRASAGRPITRDPGRALLVDERGPVGLLPGDLKFGRALVGGQGTGKTSQMARAIAADAGDRSKALIVIDPKEDLARLALGLIPRDRVVHYLDLGAPECGVNPLTAAGSPGARASMFVQALIESNPAGAIQAASDSFLRQAVAAVCEAVPEPTLWHVYRMLDPASSAARDAVIERLRRLPGSDFAVRYWGADFRALADARAFAASALNPPRNKLERLISTRQIDLLLRHPVTLDVDRILANGEVLIVNGAKNEVGEDNAIVVIQLLLRLVHRALQRQQRMPAAERRRIALYVDESHNVLTPSVATMLAEGRSAGLEACFAWQFNAQITDEVVRSGVRSLLQSVSIYRMRELEDARAMAGLAMQVYSDRIGVDPEDQSRLRFSVDDILALPAHHAINLWLADGRPQPGFLARTLPWEELADEALAEHHRAAQRERGGQRPEFLPAPDDLVPLNPTLPAPTAAAGGRDDSPL